MNKKINIGLISLLVVIALIPQITFASWWNPASWRVWNIFKASKETQVEIIEYLEKNPGARPTEMSKALGIPYLRKYLTPLIKARRVRRIKRGKEAKYFTTK